MNYNKIVCIWFLFVLFFNYSCGGSPNDLELNFEHFCNELDIEIAEKKNILIIPLSGCEEQINPLLTVIDTYYPCNELKSSLIIFDADYSNQLVQKTMFNKRSLPSCILFNSDFKAYYNGLVRFSPIAYSLKNGKIVKVWHSSNPMWKQYMNDNFFINLVEID